MKRPTVTYHIRLILQMLKLSLSGFVVVFYDEISYLGFVKGTEVSGNVRENWFY